MSATPTPGTPPEHPPKSPPEPPPLSVATCVESGPLEVMVVRMVESLRRWGGRYATCPVFAVTPRFGPALTPLTLQRFDELGVTYLPQRPPTRYAWTIYMNKLLSCLVAQRAANTPVIAWVDADMLVLREPTAWALADGEDLLACASDLGVVGTTGPDSPNEPYWNALCRHLGVEIERLPFVTTWRDSQRIRLYFNAGTFLYRRDSGFLDKYLAIYEDCLDARLGHRVMKVHFTDQVLLGLTAIRHGMGWRNLPHSYNFGTPSFDTKTYNPADVADAHVLHYHEAMSPLNWSRFLTLMRQARPDVARWLEPLGPVRDPASLGARALRRWLSYKHKLQRRLYWRRCELF